MLKNIFKDGFKKINDNKSNIKEEKRSTSIGNNIRKIYNKIYEYLKIKYKDYPIEQKIKRGFAIIMGISLIFILALLVDLGIVSNKINRLYDGPYSVVDTVGNMRTGLARIDRYMYRAMLEDDKGRIKKYIDSSNDEEEMLRQNLEKLRGKFIGDRALIDDFENNLDEALKDRELISDSLNKGDKYAARIIMDSGYKAKVDHCEKSILDIYNASELSAKNFIEDSNISRNIAFITAFIVIIIISVILIAVTKLIVEVLLEGINHVVKTSNNLSNGNLKYDEKYESKDEMGIMAKNLNSTIDGLSDYIRDISDILKNLSNGNLDITTTMEYKGDFLEIKCSLENIISSLNKSFISINEATEAVTSGAKEIALTSKSLSEGSTNQSDAIEEVVKSIVDISNKVKNNTENAARASQLSMITKTMIANENVKMKNLMNSMSDIKQSSGKISDIVFTIESIASQTNLLALNAAIEASRAGEAGKGFAVVAEEVRKLAKQSSDAVKDTTNIIRNSIKEVAQGNELAEDVMNQLNNIVNNVYNVSDLVKEISVASEVQSLDIIEITSRIDQISDVVQINSTIAEETAISTNELFIQTKSLEKEIARFNL